jgi:hypothetical protein
VLCPQIAVRPHSEAMHGHARYHNLRNQDNKFFWVVTHLIVKYRPPMRDDQWRLCTPWNARSPSVSGRWSRGCIGSIQRGMRRSQPTRKTVSVQLQRCETCRIATHLSSKLHKGMHQDARGRAMTGICTKMTHALGNSPANGLDALGRDAQSTRTSRFRATDCRDRQRGTGERRP